nr:hypothetical protein CFP56_59160 [Quercus suber]
MAKRIKTINQSLDEIKKDIPLLGLIASLNPIPQIGLDWETDSFIDGSEVVGRRDDVLKIVNLLIGANNQQAISVIHCSYNGEGSSNSRGGCGSTMLFPALEKLLLKDMDNLVEWNDMTEPTAEIGMIFTRLEHLKVSGCMELTSAPHHFPSLKKLLIDRIRGLAFEKIISELTTLTSLKIDNVSKLACLPEHFLQKNRSLVYLTICNCADLESILPHEHLWPICTSLQSLYVSKCDKLRTLPNALHNLQCLEEIVVYCPNLRSSPSIQVIFNWEDS